MLNGERRRWFVPRADGLPVSRDGSETPSPTLMRALDLFQVKYGKRLSYE